MTHRRRAIYSLEPEIPAMYLLGEYTFRSRSAAINETYMPARGHHNFNAVVLVTDAAAALQHLDGCHDCRLRHQMRAATGSCNLRLPTSRVPNQEYNVYWNFVEGTVDVAAKGVGVGPTWARSTGSTRFIPRRLQDVAAESGDFLRRLLGRGRVSGY